MLNGCKTAIITGSGQVRSLAQMVTLGAAFGAFAALMEDAQGSVLAP